MDSRHWLRAACLYAIWYFADRGRVWIFLGFPTYGEGPFEDIGIETTTTLLAPFLLVCAAELIAGWMLWQGRRAGIMLAIALLPVEFVFWIRFALPFGPILGVSRTRVMIVGTTRARRPSNGRSRRAEIRLTRPGELSLSTRLGITASQST